VETELGVLNHLAEHELGFAVCRSKLAEVVEKVLKAELIRSGWFLEKTHDLRRLAGELEDRGSDLVEQALPLCEALAEAYFTDRYPGFDLEDPDWPKLREQLAQVTALAQAVKDRVAGKS
jgi:HEPN domain-containing protein